MAEVKHKDRAHALLSASGASRWINCTPSPRLEEELNLEDTGSDFAKEGTLAHEFGDLHLQLSQAEALGHRTGIKAQLIQHRANELYTAEMEPYVEKYTDYVLEQFAELKKKDAAAVLSIEEKLDLRHLIEEGFGTGDAIIAGANEIEIIDLKYGAGIRVDADDNDQLKLYGLGALEAYDMLFDIEFVRLTIVQPRLDHISSWVISVKDLQEWATKVVIPKAKLAYAGKGEPCSGTWCQWCKVKPRCRRLAEDSMEMLKHDFADPQLLSDDELLEVYAQIPGLAKWAKSVDEHIKEEAYKGKKWKGYKLVAGKSSRAWGDQVHILPNLAKALGVAYSEIAEYKVMALTAIEKKFGKVKFKTLVEPTLVVKPQGAPTLVPESDKRPELNGVADFD